MITGNTAVLQIAVQSGYWYTVYTSTNLVNWNVITNFYATTPNAQIMDPAPLGSAIRFYQVASP